MAAEFPHLLYWAFLVRGDKRDAFAILPLARQVRKEQGLVRCLEAVARCHKLSGAQLVGDQSAIVLPPRVCLRWLLPG